MSEHRDEDMPILGVFSEVTGLQNWLAGRLFSRFDLKPWQAGILLVLAGRDLSQKEVAEKLNVTPSTITTSIQKMEREGYVYRSPDPNDLRVMRLSVTEKSKAYLEKLFEVGDLMDEIVFAGMSVEEKIVLKRLLLQVRENLRDAEKEAQKRRKIGETERSISVALEEIRKKKGKEGYEKLI